MLIKAGVDISRLRPPIRKKLPGIARIVWEIEQEELVITCTYGGTHSEGSLHYADLGVDIRKYKKEYKVAEGLRRELGMDYDVIVEPTHIHIEYDPK